MLTGQAAIGVCHVEAPAVPVSQSRGTEAVLLREDWRPSRELFQVVLWKRRRKSKWELQAGVELGEAFVCFPKWKKYWCVYVLVG